MDIGLIVAADPENEARVFAALRTLPDQAARELEPGELMRYNVIRVADLVFLRHWFAERGGEPPTV